MTYGPAATVRGSSLDLQSGLPRSARERASGGNTLASRNPELRGGLGKERLSRERTSPASPLARSHFWDGNDGAQDLGDWSEWIWEEQVVRGAGRRRIRPGPGSAWRAVPHQL
jgi:hypothetical protein